MKCPQGLTPSGWQACIMVRLSLITARGMVETKKLTGLRRSAF